MSKDRLSHFGGQETLLQKVYRHAFKEKDFSPTTLRRGLTYFRTYLESRRAGNAELLLLERHDYQDVGGNTGLNIVTFKESIPSSQGQSLFEKQRVLFDDQHYIFAHLPQDSLIQVYILNMAQVAQMVDHPAAFPEHTSMLVEKYSNSIIGDVPNSFASFPGPTFRTFFRGKPEEGALGYPNNGFFVSGNPDLTVPFMETKPAGQPRGAIAIKKDGSLVLMSDSEKWAASKNNFAEYQVVSGTSFYFTDKTKLKMVDPEQTKNRSSLSYLIQILDENGREQLIHFTAKTLVNRVQAHRLIEEYLKNLNFKSYIAVELEHLGSNLALKNQETGAIELTKTGGFAGEERMDYYLVSRKTNADLIPEKNRLQKLLRWHSV